MYIFSYESILEVKFKTLNSNVCRILIIKNLIFFGRNRSMNIDQSHNLP